MKASNLKNIYKQQNEKKEFKIGDVVYLNSEPNFKLTVKSVENNEVEVTYFNNKNFCFENKRFNKEMLSFKRTYPSSQAF